MELDFTKLNNLAFTCFKDTTPEKQPSKTSTDSPKKVELYATTPAEQNTIQTPPTTLQGIQQLKMDISREIKAGAEPYPILLKAIQVIANVTNDRSYYTVHRDVMQGMGMLESIPAEWERDSINASLQKLEASQQNISIAIAAHKQRLDSQTRDAEVDIDDEYERRIKKSFEVAYKFISGHKHARTYEDFISISRDLGKISDSTQDPLLKALLIIAFEELEREYLEAQDERRDAIDTTAL